jgi:hypothetical protein
VLGKGTATVRKLTQIAGQPSFESGTAPTRFIDPRIHRIDPGTQALYVYERGTNTIDNADMHIDNLSRSIPLPWPGRRRKPTPPTMLVKLSFASAALL